MCLVVRRPQNVTHVDPPHEQRVGQQGAVATHGVRFGAHDGGRRGRRFDAQCLEVGGEAQPIELSARDREICAAIGPELKRRGLIFVGIDVIGDYLTEINVTSPTGLQEIARFDGTRPEMKIWDAIEARLGRR